MLQFWNILYCRWKKTSDNRKFIVERHDIRSLRVKYLCTITACREEGRPIVYADEIIRIQHPMRGMTGREQDWRLLFPKDNVLLLSMLVITHEIHCTKHTFHCPNNVFWVKINWFFFRWRARFHTHCSFNIPIWFKKWRLPRRHEPRKLYETVAGEAHSKFGV